MSARLFWKQQFPLLLVHLLSMAALACFLALNGNNRDSILLILLTWSGVAGGWMVRSYLLRKHQLDALLSLSESLRETYLIGEIMQAPTRADDQVYYQILKRAGRSMLEQISAIQRERGEYREYIEQWIHEVKTPIAASKLLCENHPSPASRRCCPPWRPLTATPSKPSTTPAANTRKRTISSGNSGSLTQSTSP